MRTMIVTQVSTTTIAGRMYPMCTSRTNVTLLNTIRMSTIQTGTIRKTAIRKSTIQMPITQMPITQTSITRTITTAPNFLWTQTMITIVLTAGDWIITKHTTML